jgi:hypothetical protein
MESRTVHNPALDEDPSAPRGVFLASHGIILAPESSGLANSHAEGWKKKKPRLRVGYVPCGPFLQGLPAEAGLYPVQPQMTSPSHGHAKPAAGVKSKAVEESEDDRILHAMGYNPELRRGLDACMSFSFCFTEVREPVLEESFLLDTSQAFLSFAAHDAHPMTWCRTQKPCTHSGKGWWTEVKTQMQVAVLASITLMFSYGLKTGGPAVMLWGW